MKKTKIFSNTMYTMGGMLLLNGILQILIYPMLNRHMGSEELGVLLYVMGLVAIVCPSVGQALNNSRLVTGREHAVTNGDYIRLLLMFGGIGTAAAVFIGWKTIQAPVLVILLILLTIFRYYGDVEYRLNLNYKKYFIYYAILSAGYVTGFGLYFLTGTWQLVFLTGELAALLYLVVTGTVLTASLKKSPFFSVAFARGGFLILSYLITNLTLNMDRLALKAFIGDLAVTQYYVTSLIGKTMVLLVAPVNTIVISYLTKQKETLSRRQFLTLAGAGLGVSTIFWIAAQIGTPLFVRLFYKDLYDSVRSLFTIVNLTQILGLFSAYLFIVILTFTEEKWQLTLQILYLFLMGALILSLTPEYGIFGFAVSALMANLLRVLAVLALGIWKSGRRMRHED